jgi:hypothetical protein
MKLVIICAAIFVLTSCNQGSREKMRLQPSKTNDSALSINNNTTLDGVYKGVEGHSEFTYDFRPRGVVYIDSITPVDFSEGSTLRDDIVFTQSSSTYRFNQIKPDSGTYTFDGGNLVILRKKGTRKYEVGRNYIAYKFLRFNKVTIPCGE